MAGEKPLPESVAEQGDVIFPGLILAIQKRAAAKRLDSQQIKKIGLRFDDDGALRFSSADGADVETFLMGIDGHILKGAVLRAPIQKILASERKISRRQFGLKNLDELIGIAIWERAEKDRVDDAENRGVRADAES